MKYILLLRGVNVGGNHRVKMSEFKIQLQEAGFKKVTSYINSGNLFFDSLDTLEDVRKQVDLLLEQYYDFSIPFALISKESYEEEYQKLPDWWQKEGYRFNALFYTDLIDKVGMQIALSDLQLKEERIHIGEVGVFWAVLNQEDYSKSAYANELIKKACYKQVTIRNRNTCNKIKQLIEL